MRTSDLLSPPRAPEALAAASERPPSSGLTALLPCYNEGARVARAYEAICEALGGIDELEILVVDDGSRDDTLARVRALAERDPRVKYLSFTRNYGLEAAHGAGFRYATKPWLVQLDADLQSPPAETWRLLAVAAEGDYDVVFAERVDRQDPVFRRLGSEAMHFVAKSLLGIELPHASTFRVMRTPVARTLAELRLGSPYTIALVPMLGARYTCVATAHDRREGRSRWRLSRLVGHAFELWFGYSWRPLNAVYAVAAAAVAFGAIVGVLAAAGAVSAAGLAGSAAAVSVAGVACVALVARYLHRLMLDARRTRPYYIREANIPLDPADTLDGGAPRVRPPIAVAAATGEQAVRP